MFSYGVNNINATIIEQDARVNVYEIHMGRWFTGITNPQVDTCYVRNVMLEMLSTACSKEFFSLKRLSEFIINHIYNFIYISVDI